MTTRIDTSLKLFTWSSSIWLFSRRIPDRMTASTSVSARL